MYKIKSRSHKLFYFGQTRQTKKFSHEFQTLNFETETKLFPLGRFFELLMDGEKLILIKRKFQIIFIPAIDIIS